MHHKLLQAIPELNLCTSVKVAGRKIHCNNIQKPKQDMKTTHAEQVSKLYTKRICLLKHSDPYGIRVESCKLIEGFTTFDRFL